MNNSVFEKTMENVRKHKYIRPVTANKTRSYLVSAPNYHKKKRYSENLLASEMNKQK